MSHDAHTSNDMTCELALDWLLARGSSAVAALLLLVAAPALPPWVALPFSPLHAQQTADVIRGRVTGPDSQPIPNAQITAVSYFGGITKTARTDKNGRFSITYPNGEGDYWISFSALGYQPRRFA